MTEPTVFTQRRPLAPAYGYDVNNYAKDGQNGEGGEGAVRCNFTEGHDAISLSLLIASAVIAVLPAFVVGTDMRVWIVPTMAGSQMPAAIVETT